MGLFSNPLGYAGYPPNPVSATVQNSTVRAATAAEVAAGVLNDAYVSPATASSLDAGLFASPPALGSTTPNAVTATALTVNTSVTLADGVSVAVGSTNGSKIGTATTQKLGFFNATPIVQPANTTDLRTAMINLGFLATGGATPLNLNGGALSAGSASVTAPSVSGASPVTNNSRAGQASFTDAIANGAFGTLTISNSTVTSSSIILAVASCATASSAVQIVGITPSASSIALRIFNAGSASTTGNNINVNYWVLN